MNLFKFNKDKAESKIPLLDETFSEQDIEKILENNPILLTGDKVLIIGRQVKTSTGKKLDLLAIDRYSRLIVVELKMGIAPRDILAQVLDYTSWISKLSERKVEKIAKEYFEKCSLEYRTLHEAFEKTFDKEMSSLGDETVSVLFAKYFSQEVTNPAEYLNKKGVPIKCIQFEFFGTKARKFLVTKAIVGDEFESEEEEKEVTTSLDLKKKFKQLIDRLSGYLEENYGSWSTGLSSERVHGFKTYQSRPGDWTCSYIEWLFKDKTKLCLEFAIYPESEDDDQSFCIYFHSRTQSSTLASLFKSRSDLSHFFKDFDNESAINKPRYAKYIKVDEMNFKSLKKLASLEMEKIKPLIESIR